MWGCLGSQAHSQVSVDTLCVCKVSAGWCQAGLQASAVRWVPGALPTPSAKLSSCSA